MKIILCLSFFLCVAGVLSDDYETIDGNLPSSYDEFIENQLETTEQLNEEELSAMPESPLTDDIAPNKALCWDSRLARFVEAGLQMYPTNMAKMTRYILDQIVRSRYPGFWMVHGQKVAYGTQGPDWQTLSSGNVFSGTNPNTCFLHNTKFYIIVVRLY
uniref:Uncharacterized protein n=1 Tax=Plectus sambesii TaxID=2011161 RepID=A0A914WPL9_9BILA